MKPKSDEKEIRKELDDLLWRHLGPRARQVLEDHVLNPKHAGQLDIPDGMASVMGRCDDTIRIEIKVSADRIVTIRFTTNGCMALMACASVTTDLAKERTIREAYKITEKAISAALGGLPTEHSHCAAQASDALRGAIENYLHTKREPWKRIYRKSV